MPWWFMANAYRYSWLCWTTHHIADYARIQLETFGSGFQSDIVNIAHAVTARIVGITPYEDCQHRWQCVTFSTKRLSEVSSKVARLHNPLPQMLMTACCNDHANTRRIRIRQQCCRIQLFVPHVTQRGGRQLLRAGDPCHVKQVAFDQTEFFKWHVKQNANLERAVVALAGVQVCALKCFVKPPSPVQS